MLRNVGEDKWFRYSPKGLVVRESFILTPEDAPEYATNRSELWNRVEEIETRKNARLGRDMELGLAYELDHDQQRELVTKFAQREFVDRGFVVDVAIHNYGRTLPAMGGSEDQAQRIREWAQSDIPFLSKDDADGRSDQHVMEMTNRDGDVTGYKLYQPHAHLRVTPRVCEGGEFVNDKKASRELNRHDRAMQWRYEWPKLQNDYLETAGSDVRVTSTSAQDNEGIKETFLELEEPAGSESEQGEQTRVALWWHNTAARFNAWRFEFREQASEWRERFEHQKTRIRQVIGWHDTPVEMPDGSVHQAETAEPTTPPPEQEPER